MVGMVKQAFLQVRSDKDWLMKTLVGGLFSFGVMIIPLLHYVNVVPLLALSVIVAIFCSLVVGGYLLLTLHNSIEGLELPFWRDWRGILLNGAYLVVTKLAYFIPGFIFVAITARLSNFSRLLLVASKFSLVIAAALLGIGALLFPAALANIAMKKTLRAAFQFNEILDLIKSKGQRYVLACIGALVVAAAWALVSFIATFLFVTLIVVPFLHFFAGLLIMQLFGSVFALPKPIFEVEI